MKNRKDFNQAEHESSDEKALTASSPTPILKPGIPKHTAVHFGPNATGSQNFDFSQHYGQGFDAITNAVQQTIEIMLSESKPQASTVSKYCYSGYKNFADYLVIYRSALSLDLGLSDITPELLQNYIQHLKIHYPNGASAKNHYTHIKSILVKMQKMAWFERFDFPKNPFPYSNRKMKGQTAFSKAERRRVANALKIDINEILKKSDPLTSYELTVCLLGIALRSGMNTTPLLEMTIDSIQDHPLKENRKLLVLYKRRGNATHIQSLRHAKSVENAQTVLADVAVIAAHIIRVNAPLRAKIGSDLVFSYQSTKGDNAGEITSLSDQLILYYIKPWVKQHQLKNDNCDALKVNISRFRKTFENRIWALSGGDPFVTAAMSNHTVSTSVTHYLEAPKEAEKNFNYMGKIRTDELLGSVIENNTPVSKCSNSPKTDKNGNKIYCTDFLSCIRCRNMVVTKEDLYRLFSFYWLIVYEREQIGAKRWRKYFAHIIRIIDRDIVPKFDADADYVSTIRAEAQANPHPFWKNRAQLESVA
ncbi:MAG: hypothetical protein HOM11_16520 [Methylococcales bacterium]|jgi:hypothetical protein|nr:hypothetical protein [Methylococcales bacterium]MBT7443840.1 hypothetical protein [Methylococcales bacterium]